MFRFYLKSAIEDPQKIIITDQEIIKKVTKVLRLQTNDLMVVFDSSGEEYEVRLQEIKAKQLICSLNRRLLIDRELSQEINLYQALLKNDKLEWLAQKVTEIGVKRIIPIITDNCVVKELNVNKVKRYQKIITEATMQSGGKIPPAFELLMTFEQAVRQLNQRDINIFCHEAEETTSLASVLTHKSSRVINLFIGPEGGFSQFEIDLSQQNSLTVVSLGRRILRSETAAIVACSLAANLN